jgi:ABC-2 type transport system ATP-binding protein
LATGDDLRLDGVGKRYGVRLPWVVRDVNLEIGPGALVRLEGRNGTGKSTLLRVIAGVSAPSKGSVAGRPVTGYVPERFPPALPFSARDYLSHVGRVHGMTSAELAERIQYCLDRLGGWEFAGVPLRHMSKGMCQKVAVAQALLPASGLLVLDEAWTGLDVEAKGALDEVVAERLADGGSVVYVDHDPQRLAQLDAQRWRIEDGQARPVFVDGAEAAPAPAAPAPAGAPPGVAEPAEADSEPWPAEGAAAEAAAVLIEVAGYPDGGPDPGGLPGVLSARADGDLWLVRAASEESGAVLRALLAAGDAVHVLEVRKPEARP